MARIPLGALGAPIRNRPAEAAPEVTHRFAHLEAWLDYAIELGCSGIILGPIFDSISHGYDTLDHFRIDPRLGDDADFDHFVSACQQRGLSLMLDGVFNHVAATHPRADELVSDSSGWEGHSELVTLDHSSETIRALVTDVMLHWLRRGIAGWRLDVAYSVPTDFWRDVTQRVRSEFPRALFLGEVIHGDYAGFIRESTLDTLTQYELWKAIWSSLKEANFWELEWTLRRHNELLETFIPQTFIGNHDVTRIATEVGEEKAALAAAILFTLPGMPSVYYGDEQGFRGRKLESYHADDEIRTPLPASPAELYPHGQWMYRLYQELIGLRRRHHWLANGRVEVVGKDNLWIEYTIHPSDGTSGGLRVRVQLDPRPEVWIVDDVDLPEATAAPWDAARASPFHWAGA
ncbi:alpha-amylase family protein [Actinobaculum sp. 313]|uniref:alpha-amylase family protein n=1 Tax=Actinobaculum sp. 313 TaxID=2495645 RepID=UPI001F0C334B|nr:alpha-amylase family protein [Actinobaculum sp. 313]